jgi:hypothetical protein
MRRNLATVVRGAASIGSAAVRHAAWYLRYQVDGTARAQRARPASRRDADR